MRRDSTGYDKTLDEGTSTEDDFALSSSELDLLNPRLTQAHSERRSLRRKTASKQEKRANLPKSQSPGLTCHLSRSASRQCAQEKLLRPEEDTAASSEQPQPRNSKSSVVVLYHESNVTTSAASKTPLLLRSSKSDQSIAGTQWQDRQGEAPPLLPVKSKALESPETLSPRYSIPRRRSSALRRSRRASKRQEPLSVNIYHKSRVVQVAPPMQYNWTTVERLEESYCREHGDFSAPARSPLTTQVPQHAKNEKPMKKCHQSSDRYVPQAMAQTVNSGKVTNEAEERKQCLFSSNLGVLMQHMQQAPPKGVIPPHANESEEARRVFPFQATPSGNLKVIPDQVVFESKKVSVLVADPRHTKVNVKAELDKSNGDMERSVPSAPSAPSVRQGYVDLPPGVTPSTINHLQAQQKLPNAQESQYKPRTQPYKAKTWCPAMEQKQSPCTTSQEVPPLTNEVALSSLGFTSDQPIDWDSIILPEKTDLYEELARRINNYKNADCIVRIGHDEFHCHLLVLQSYSAFFDEKNCKNIDLTGTNVTSRAFSIIYDWMISCTNDSCHFLRRDNILEVFMGAQYLGIKELEEQCWAFIDNDELFSEDTAYLLYMEAKKIGNNAVMELMVPRIMKFFLMLVSTKDFLELSVDELCLLLKSNYICVNSEMEVLMSAVRWLMHDWENRKQHMLEVLKCVRFGLIAPWQLVDVKRNPENPEFMELMSYPDVQKMVDDGLAFVIIKYWYGNQTEDYYHWIDLLGLTEPTNRNWAGEDKNYVTYREFLLYLEEYQKSKMSELKAGKSQAKSTSPGQSPSRSYATTSKNRNSNYPQLDASISGQRSGPTRNSMYRSKVLPCGNVAAGAMPCEMPPEILNEYLGSLNRNNDKAYEQQQRRPQERFGKQVNFNPNLIGAGEFLKRSCDPQRMNENEAPNVRYFNEGEKKERRSRQSNISKDNAATVIQSIYRGYKTRRKYNEIRKTWSEGKQNARRVAELLSLPVGQNPPPPPVLHRTLEPTKATSTYMGNQSKSENGLRTVKIERSDAAKNIETIKSPCFFSNFDGRNSCSVTPSDNTDPDDTSSPGNNLTLGSIGAEKYFLHNSLFYVDRESVLIFGGVDPHGEYGCTGNTGKDMYRFKAEENSWEFVGEIPEPRHHHSVVYLKGRIYLVGGADPRENNRHKKSRVVGTVWSYDPFTRVWYNETEMLTPRKNFGLVVSHGKMFAIGGQDRNGLALRTVEAFDPSERAWREVQAMHTARVGPASVNYREFIWVAGGMTKSKEELFSKDVECYDPVSNSWLKGEPLRLPRCFASLYVVSDYLYAIGGATATENSTDSIDSIDVWDPNLHVWKEKTSMSIARHGHSTASIGIRLLIMGGVTTIFMKTLDSVECYCCESGKWIKGISPLPHAISGHSTVSLPPASVVLN